MGNTQSFGRVPQNCGQKHQLVCQQQALEPRSHSAPLRSFELFGQRPKLRAVENMTMPPKRCPTKFMTKSVYCFGNAPILAWNHKRNPRKISRFGPRAANQSHTSQNTFLGNVYLLPFLRRPKPMVHRGPVQQALLGLHGQAVRVLLLHETPSSLNAASLIALCGGS